MYNWGQTSLKVANEEWRMFKKYGTEYLNERGYDFDCEFIELFENVIFGSDTITVKYTFDRDNTREEIMVYDMMQNYIQDTLDDDERFELIGAAIIGDEIDDAREVGGIDDAPFVVCEVDPNAGWKSKVIYKDKLMIIID
jgi:hypothetical protein